MHQSPMPDHREETRNVFGILVFIAQSMAVSVEVFLHGSNSFGERYFGLPIVGAILIVILWPLLCEPGHDPRPLLMFLAAFLSMCLFVRWRTGRRIRRDGPQLHTRYNGTPRLMRVAFGLTETTVKRALEPGITWLVGGLMLSVSPPLGGYLMVASLCLFISNSLTDGYERRRALDMHDAYVEQRNVAERFREMRGQ